MYIANSGVNNAVIILIVMQYQWCKESYKKNRCVHKNVDY